jgi:hypothetical protein
VVSSVNLWPQSGNKQQPKEEEVKENKDKANGKNAGDRTDDTQEGIGQQGG